MPSTDFAVALTRVAVTAPVEAELLRMVPSPVKDETPPADMVLQPNPVPLVHVRALDAELHDGIERPDGVVAVVAPNTVLAVCVASDELALFDKVLLDPLIVLFDKV